jgi:hypothetical protein
MKHVPSSDEAIRMTDERKKQFDIFFSLASEEIERLAQALFNKQEQMLPNGDVWADLSDEDKNFWISSADSVISELKKVIFDHDGR